MARKYTPRRAGARWLKDAPAYVLDCFDDARTVDRYTVLFTGNLLETDGTFDNTFVHGLGMSSAPSHPQGISMWLELKAYEAAAYRYRNHHRRVRWLDLPKNIRRHVEARCAPEEEYKCSSCGREETACNLNPCPAVIADREGRN